MEQGKISGFQFLGHKILESHIVRNVGDVEKKFDVSFTPEGVISNSNRIFTLYLDVHIEDLNKTLSVDITAMADFNFDDNIENETLQKFLSLNAPALLFPYIRAYISTLTNLSGVETITLPTMNLVPLAEDLKKNTKVED